METSAKATSFPKYARLERDKGNYPVWRRHIYDVLQASGCEQAITQEFAFLSCDSSDSSSSGEDSGSDGDELRRTLSSLRLGKHDPQPSPTPSQDDKHERAKKLFASFSKAGKKERGREKKRRKKKKKFEETKTRMDARARTAINSTIDSKAFAASTMSCHTAYQLWEELKPTEAYTEEDVHRSLDKVRIELCSNDMELCERMHNVVNKVAFILPGETKQYETRVVKAALLNLKQSKHKLRFLDLLVHMSQRDTPQTVTEFEGQFLKIIKEEKEVE